MLFALAVSLTATAQVKVVDLWNNSTAPHSNGVTAAETEKNGGYYNITQTQLYIYAADPAKATGQAAVLCPGGGYKYVSLNREGHEIGAWLAENGITGVMLKYRLPNGHSEIPLNDVDKAVATVREMADELGVDPHKVGVSGTSAGGYLAGSAGIMSKTKPDFMVLIYPVVSSTPGIKDHETYENLVGVERIPQLADRYSPEKQADETACPAILFHSDDDDDTPAMNSVVLYNRLRELGIPASLHIYPSGGHGWGMGKRFRYHEHFKAATIDWLKSIAN